VARGRFLWTHATAVPYLHNGKPSEYLPGFVIRLAGASDLF
jgi:hypothetical protein